MKLELHPLCTLFPRMAGTEFAALKADILANGLRQPIILHEGMILDGGNRYAACIETGIEPAVVDYAGTDIVAFVLSVNLHRRHMSAGQRAAIVASAADCSKAQKHGGDRKSDRAVTLPLDSVAERSAQSGASDKTQRDADKVAKANPELAQQVGQGTVTLAAAKAQVEGKPRKPAKPKAEPAPEDEDYATTEALIDELNAENLTLQARVDALTTTDLGKKVDDLMRMVTHATREKDVEMDKNARLIKERDSLSRFQSDVVRASGSKDPKAALLWVKSMAATQRDVAE